MFSKKRAQSLWFTEQFQQLHQSGLGFADSLVLLEKSCTHADFSKVIHRILRSVKRGRSFSHSLKQYPDYFSETYLAMVAVGEQSGHLGQVFQELAAYLSLHQRVRQNLLEALTYPCLILILMMGMMFFLLYFVIPQFELIFEQFKAPLPWLTVCLFGFIHHLKFFGMAFLIALIGFSLFFKKYFHIQWKRFKKNQSLLRWPILGAYYQDWLLMFLFKTLSLSLKSGLTLQQALLLLPKLFGTTPFSQLIFLLQRDLREGLPLEKIFDKKEYFPDICKAYIQIASVSGALDHQLNQLGVYFEGRVYAKINRLKILLEPLILLVTGTLVGVVVIALYQPLFSLGGLM